MRSGFWVIGAATAAWACSSAFDGAQGAASDGAFGGATSSLGGAPGAAGSAVLGPPEREEGQSYRAPVVSGRWVWTANPDTGKIAVVDARSFEVRLADAGSLPTYLTALPTAANTSRALVINVGSHDATLLSAAATGPVSSVGPIPLAPDANTWTVSSKGKFAIAWTDSQGLTADPTQGFQDLSVVDLRAAKPSATRLSVGFLPSRVFIDTAEQRAYVVARSGISVIALADAGGPRVLREEPLSTDLAEDARTRDVSVMPDGSYAFVRHEGSPEIGLLELESGALSTVTLSGPVTDLDLVADATSALAVVRSSVSSPPLDDGTAGAANDGTAGATNAGAAGDASAGTAGTEAAGATGAEGGAANPGPAAMGSKLVILPLPGIFSAPGQFETVTIDEVFGLVNLAPQGSAALLYTNAVPSSHLTILETAHGSTYLDHRTLDLRGNVQDVFPSPDGTYAIASLKAKEASAQPGFAAVPVNKALPARVQTTEAPVFAVAQSSGEAARAIVTVSDGATHFAAYVLRMPELVIDQVKLPSRPLPGATGLVPDAGVAYIAQAHPQGRITFINLETGVPRTITGFEISAKVSDGR